MYDSAQLAGMGLPCLPPHCNYWWMGQFENFYQVFMQQVHPVVASTGSGGYYLDSCVTHCQTLDNKQWVMASAQGQAMSESFSDWYYERASSANTSRIIDCKYPCNYSCP